MRSNFKQKMYFYLLLMCLFFFISCKKEEQFTRQIPQLEVESYSAKSVNSEVSKFAINVSKALENSDFRNFIKEEALKQFDGEYNVLYQFVKESRVNGKRVIDLLQPEVTGSNEIFDSLLIKVPNIQIAVPVNIEKWNSSTEIPWVIYLPVDFDDSIEQNVIAFKSDGSTITLNSKTPPDFPVVVVSVSQRVDEKLNLIVDEDNVVLSKEIRKPAINAYLTGDFKSKMYEKKSDNPFVRIVSKKYIDDIKEIQTKKLLLNEQFIEGSDKSNSIETKNIQLLPLLPSPTLSFNYPSTGLIVELSWTGVEGADFYRIYRRTETTTFSPYKVVWGTTIFDDQVLTAGVVYKYYVTAGNKTGESYPSNVVTAKSAIRWQGGREELRSIYMTDQLTWDLESWIVGPHLEIVIDVHQANNVSPTGARWEVLKRDIHRDDLSDETYMVNGTIINSWNLDRGDAYYVIKITERDNTGKLKFNFNLGFDKVVMGATIKSSLAYEWEYTWGNDDGGHVEVEWYHSPRQEYLTSKGIKVNIGYIHPDVPCPYGGTPVTLTGMQYACLVFTPPTGSKISKFNGWFYYSPVSNQCPIGGVLTVSGCRYIQIPTDISPVAFLQNNKGYYPRGF